MAATAVRSVADLRPDLLKPGAPARLRLERGEVSGLGPVVTAPGQQVRAGGGLRTLAQAEKPGASTDGLLRELGFEPDRLVESGAAARQLSADYLPA